MSKTALGRVPRQVRIAVVGATGCSVLSEALSRRLGIPHIALPGGHGRQDRALGTETAAAGDRWVMNANGRAAREYVWPRATMIVWLDYAPGLVLAHALWRTLRRVLARALKQRELAAAVRAPRCANRALRLARSQHARRRAEFGPLLDPRWVRLTSLSDTRDWLRDVTR